MTTSELADLVDTEQTAVTAMHVAYVFGSPEIYAGFIGYNIFAVQRAVGFVDAVVSGDVIQVAQGEQGTYEATGFLGRRPNQLEEYKTYQLPWDHQQNNIGVGMYMPASPLPAAYVYVQGRPARFAEYGTLDAVDVTSVAYWGNSTLFHTLPTPDLEPAQKLSLVTDGPNPRPLTMTLLSGRFPGDPSSTVDVDVTPTLVYRGPDTPTVVDLPANWITALAAGDAGSIRFAPSDSTPGVTRLLAGPAGSLTLHR